MNWLTRLFGTRSTVATTTRRPTFTRLRLESLEDRVVPTVTYHGGAVLQHVETQGLYLGSTWSSQSTPATLDGFLSNITNSAYMDALTRAGYGIPWQGAAGLVGRGSSTAGYLDPAKLVAGSTITDAYIQSEIKADITAGRLTAPDANKLYVVYVDPNVAVKLGGATSQHDFLGYHGAFYAANGTIVHYAVITSPGGAAHNASMGGAAIDQLTSVTSHELAEAVTDPNVNLTQLGWYDDQRNGENGDITENNPDALVRLNGYLVQQVAALDDSLLLINGPSNPPPTPPTSTTATSTSMKAGRVHYNANGTASVALTVLISPSSGTVLPDGQVQLVYNGSVLGTGTVKVVHGVAQVTFNVTFSSYSQTTWDYYIFSASYLGSSHFGASSSHSLTVGV